MSRGRHASRHSQSKPAPDRTSPSPRWTGLRKSRWLVAAAAFCVLAGLAVEHGAANYQSTADNSAVSCLAATRLTADSSDVTLLGASASTPSALAQATAQFGHMPIIRVFYSGLPSPNAWTTGAPAVNKSAVVVSFNALPDTILSGADDAALSHFFDTAPSGHPIYYSYYHEPEVHIADGQFTLSAYKAAWAHVVSLADAAHNSDLRSTLILTSWDLSPQSGRNWQDYLPGGGIISTLGWDDYPPGTVENHDPLATPPADFMSAEVAAAKSAGLPFGFAEFALGTQADRPGWLTEVANYLQSNGALFGTYFDSPGFPWMVLNDTASIQEWRSAVAHSTLKTSGSTAVTTPSLAATTPAPIPTRTATPRPTRAPDSTGLVITRAAVRPTRFAPTGANHVRIRFKLSQRADVTICVLDSQGTAVRQLSTANLSAGWSTIWYFGYDDHSRLLTAGRYSILIAASNADGGATAKTTLSITGR